eukprot:800769-Rhodomonas_salina.1
MAVAEADGGKEERKEIERVGPYTTLLRARYEMSGTDMESLELRTDLLRNVQYRRVGCLWYGAVWCYQAATKGLVLRCGMARYGATRCYGGAGRRGVTSPA